MTGGLTGQGFGRGGEAIVNVGNNVITCNDNWEATSRVIVREASDDPAPAASEAEGHVIHIDVIGKVP